MNKIIKSMMLSLALLTVVPVNAVDWKKAKSYSWQAFKIVVGFYIFNHTGLYANNTMNNGKVFIEELTTIAKDPYFNCALQSNTPLTSFFNLINASDNFKCACAQYISPDKWDKKTFKDLMKARIQKNTVYLTSMCTALGLIISGIKGIYDEYQKPQEETNQPTSETNELLAPPATKA